MAVVSRDELAVYCKVDGELLDHACDLAETMERRLIRKGALDTPGTHADFCLAVKQLTLHELDHPGEKIPQGIQDTINELKFGKSQKGGMNYGW